LPPPYRQPNLPGIFPRAQGNLPPNRPFFAAGRMQPFRQGGLFSRILQRQPARIQHPYSLFSFGPGQAQTGSGLLQGLTNPQRISNVLRQTQQFLQAAQQITPMIQQYGPIVRNLPSFLKIYREMKAGGNEGTDPADGEPAEGSKEPNPEGEDPSGEEKQKDGKRKNGKKKRTKRMETKPSVPKLYI